MGVLAGGGRAMSVGETQRDVAAWFDHTYDTSGFDYLRPLEAYPIFLQLLGATAGQKLLDVACGPGLLLQAARIREVAPTGIDLSASAVKIAREFVPGAEVEVANVEEIPFPDGTFDCVSCVGAIERFLDRRRALAEMRRVGRDDARFCFMVRNADTAGWRIWRQALGRRNEAGHQDALRLEQWRALFAECGFREEGVFIDQWLRQRLRKVLRGFRARDLREAEPVAKPILPLRFANEFIFILRKAEGGAG